MIKALCHLMSRVFRRDAALEAESKHGRVVYCHKGEQDSDIDLFRVLDEGEEGMECGDCSLLQKEPFLLVGTQMQYPMTLHLNDHVFAGDKVPERVYDRLEEEIHA